MKKEKEIVECKNCERKFVQNRPHMVFCSSTCRNDYHNELKMELIQYARQKKEEERDGLQHES